MALVKYNNNSISAITTAGQLASGSMVLIKEQTASSSSDIQFIDGTSSVVLDNTYPIYKFQFINLHPSNDGDYLNFNLSTDGGSNYNAVKTTTHFYAYHSEAGSSSFGYDTSADRAQSTLNQQIALSVGNDNDQAFSGELWIYSPSSTTFVKHFMSIASCCHSDSANNVQYMAGYANTTSAVDALKFFYYSGNIDSGTIKLYGIRDS